MEQDNQDPRYKHRFTRDFTPMPRDLCQDGRLAMLSLPAQAHYIRLRIITDEWGNYPADIQDIRYKLYGRMCMDNPHGCPSLDVIDQWHTELADADMIEIYYPEEDPQIAYLHIDRFSTAGRYDWVRLPTYPTHPKQPKVMKHRKHKKKSETRSPRANPVQEEEVDSKVEVYVKEEVKGNRCATSEDVILHDGQGGYIHPERDGTETPAAEMADWAAKFPDNLQSLYNYRDEICKRPYAPAERDAAVVRIDAMIAEYQSRHPDGGGVNLGRGGVNLGKDNDDAAAAEGIA